MKHHCEDGKELCEHYEEKLKVWGSAEVNKRAAELIVGGAGHAASLENTKQLKDCSCGVVASHSWPSFQTSSS
jgi:hypothetical protein